MALLTWPEKDPQETLDYYVDYSGRIPADDEITQSSWSVPSGITATQANFAGRKTVIWLSGGTEGGSYELTNTVQTTDGRILEQTCLIVIVSK
jgi:hypothetical protein